MEKLTNTEKAILNTLCLNGSLKKSAIAEDAKLPWATTCNSLGALCDKMMVIECDDDKNKYIINKSYAFFLGISVGTSQIKICILDFTLSVVKEKLVKIHLSSQSKFRDSFWEQYNLSKKNMDNCAFCDDDAVWCAPTPYFSLFDLNLLLTELCNFAIELKDNGLNLVSICVSFSGKIDNVNNMILESKNLNFDLTNVGLNNLILTNTLNNLREKSIDISIEHNVKSAAVAEVKYNNFQCNRSNRNIAVLYLGAGLGVSLIFDGKMVRGKTNSAGQIGHMLIKDMNVSHKYGDESEILEYNLRNNGKINFKMHTGKELTEIFSDEEKDIFINYLSNTIYNLYMLLEIDTVVFSGKLADIYLAYENYFQEKMIKLRCNNISFFISKYKEFSSSIGAAICAYQNYIDLPFEWMTQ